MYIGPKRDSILAASSLIRICQEEKIADKIASVNQALGAVAKNATISHLQIPSVIRSIE
jgi:hypothetical protein